jgi:hypothetical protein
MSTMKLPELREQFEAWVRGRFEDASTLLKDPQGRYLDHWEQGAWTAWQDRDAYAEEAVRLALAAQVPVAACLLGYGSKILTTDTERIHDGWKGLALIPENSDG